MASSSQSLKSQAGLLNPKTRKELESTEAKEPITTNYKLPVLPFSSALFETRWYRLVLPIDISRAADSIVRDCCLAFPGSN